jgi:iron-sulfur cluster insertion protein
MPIGALTTAPVPLHNPAGDNRFFQRLAHLREFGQAMPTDASLATDGAIQISERAARRIAHLVESEGTPATMLRIAVSGGGCSGFQYGFSLDDQRRDDDRIFARWGATVVVDEISLDLLKGAELDYVEDLVGSYFAVRNPNATSTCGCGTSFAV